MSLTRSGDGVFIDRDSMSPTGEGRVERGPLQGGRYGDVERLKQNGQSKNGEQDLRQKRSTRERTKADRNLQLLEGLSHSARGLRHSYLSSVLILHNCAAI